MRNKLTSLFRRVGRADPRNTGEIRHPVRSDFHTVVTKAGLSVTFQPTNSTYSFVADNNIIARPVSFAGVQHAGHNTGDYPSDEVQYMARQIASEYALVHFVQLQLLTPRQ